MDKKYKLVNISDGNIVFELSSNEDIDALQEALEILGYKIVFQLKD